MQQLSHSQFAQARLGKSLRFVALVLPYGAVAAVACIYWQFGASVPELILLFPLVGLALSEGRGRAQRWTLSLVIAATAFTIPWLTGRLVTAAAWFTSAFAALATLVMLGRSIELHHTYASRAKRQAESLRRAELMATVGVLATAAAHEIRNPLTTIKGFIQYLRQSTFSQPQGIPFLDLIERDADRIARLVNDFVRLGRPLPVVPTHLDADEVVQQLVQEFAEQALLTGVDIQVKSTAAPPVWADRALMQKAVRHVVQNGLEAMAGRSGRLLVQIMPANGGFVEIRIQDNGRGMDRRQLQRAFEAFYTTKSGSGLGLPIVRRIMDAHGGDIRLQSRHRSGTTVSLIWPTAPVPTPHAP